MASSAQQPHEDPAYGFSIVKVTILASEWGSSKGGFFTMNRELAIQLAKCPEAEITVFLPQCSEDDKKLALSHNVTIVEATPRPGYEELDWLAFPPKELQIDVVVGHGVKLGRQAQFIRDSHNCRWIQVAHTDPEELGMFKVYANPISKGVEKHRVEVQLCEKADFVVGIGPKLTEAFRSYLRGCGKDQNVHDLTPGIFGDFPIVQQVPDNRKNCQILVFGRGDAEDFTLKGFDIAGIAVASLPETHLVFIGGRDGNQEEIAARFLECGIPRNRLKVRCLVDSREMLKLLFCEADLALMPSSREGFGLTGLQALSAGLPVLVSRYSGFGQALSKVPFGKSYVIDSEEPAVWAAAITEIWNKDVEQRIEEADALRASYSKKYSWAKQSRDLLQKMIDLTHDLSSSSHSSAQRAAKMLPCATQGSQWTADMSGCHLVKEGNPSDYELEGLSQKIVRWKSLGRRLNFDEVQLFSFDIDNWKSRGKAYAMLGKWKERDGAHATYQVLYDALCHADVQCKDLAQELCCRVEAPWQILARGPEAIEAYNRALIDGEGFVKRVPIMIIGQDRTGKTSLLKSLKGQPFDANEKSTEGIEIDPSHFEVSKEIWEEGKGGKDTDDGSEVLFEQLAAQIICQTLKKEEEKESSGQEKAKEGGPSLFVPELPENIADLVKTLHQNGESSMDELATDLPHFEKGGASSEENAKEGGPSLFVPELPENIADLVEKLLQNDKNVDDDDKICSVVWDFGGQSVYYATHPIFLTERAIYILASDLSRSPFEKDKAPSRKGMYKDIEDVDCCNTNLDYLDFWMSSVYSLTSSSAIRQDAIVSDSKNLPPVFLVFTHADEPYCEKDSRELALEVYGILRDQSKIYRGHLFKDVFVVDNTKSGSDSECQEVVRLREDILTVAKNLPQMKERIPLKWLRYENILQLLNKEGYKWIPVEKARQVAMEKCGIDDSKQFQTLLNFLHDQKMLIHFNETPELDNVVILDPQWLVDIFKRVITIPRYEPSEDCVEELWSNLEKDGILDERLLEHAWKPLVQGEETINSLIAIMERFTLLCPWPSNDTNKQYLVPSMLMSPASDDVLELLASVQIPSLFVRFESGRVPAGLFPRLVLQFYQRCKEEWKSPVNPELFHNFALFHIRPDQGTSVIWLCHSSFIEVAIYTANDSSGTVKDFNDCNFDSTTGHSINRQLRSILECMREEFHWLRTMRYEMCVCCPVCSQKGSPKCRSHDVRGCGCLHLLSESDLKQRQFCTRPGVRGDIRIDINMFASWFELSRVRKRLSSLQPQDASGDVLDERTNPSSRKVSNDVSQDALEWLSRMIGNWEPLAYRLGFVPGELYGIQRDSHGDNSAQARRMLIRWKQRNGKNATLQVLCEALRNKNVGRTDLAEQMERGDWE